MNISDYLEDRIHHHNFNVHLRTASEKAGDSNVLGACDKENNQIILYLDTIDQTYERGCMNINRQEYIELVFCHELGHFLDQEFSGMNDKKNLFNEKKNFLEKNLNDHYEELCEHLGSALNIFVKLEENAWKYGRELAPAALLGQYDQLNDNNIKGKFEKLFCQLISELREKYPAKYSDLLQNVPSKYKFDERATYYYDHLVRVSIKY
ncbi:MAG: hypothetical protein K0R57_1664 [Paenibacillaceae bacterium]|nr:hypothetical protein [Paenibacillaceae bacterium]